MERREETRAHTPRDDRPTRDDRSIGTLLSELTRETTTLVQQEVALARTEIAEKVTQLELGITSLLIGGIVLLGGFLILLHAAVYGLAELFFPDALWLAALIVGGVVAIIGAILLQAGRSKLQARHLVPQRTAASLQHDKDLIKEHMQ